MKRTCAALAAVIFAISTQAFSKPKLKAEPGPDQKTSSHDIMVFMFPYDAAN
ncbi:hypothetical protein FHU13_003024 [Methylobacterium sp. R2-1]|nr:hypothetical protein [Methylobacterium sp. R2-1]